MRQARSGLLGGGGSDQCPRGELSGRLKCRLGLSARWADAGTATRALNIHSLDRTLIKQSKVHYYLIKFFYWQLNWSVSCPLGSCLPAPPLPGPGGRGPPGSLHCPSWPRHLCTSLSEEVPPPGASRFLSYWVKLAANQHPASRDPVERERPGFGGEAGSDRQGSEWLWIHPLGLGLRVPTCITATAGHPPPPVLAQTPPYPQPLCCLSPQ